MPNISKPKLNKSLQEKLTVFKDFTEKAIDVLGYAQQEAQAYNRKHLDSSHILLGLLIDEYCHANYILKKQGVALSITRELFERQWDPKKFEKRELSGFTSFAITTFEKAQEFCNELGHNYIGTEHLLYGILNEEQRGNLAYHILTEPFGVTSKGIEKQIKEFLGGD